MVILRPRHCFNWQSSATKKNYRNKICYPSERIAKEALKIMEKKYPERHPNDVYYCESCDHWHLRTIKK